MTFRERLADWITGGELTWLKIDIELREENRAMWRDRAFARNAEIGNLKLALRDIAAMETPNCAHIGKRMAKAARDALK